MGFYPLSVPPLVQSWFKEYVWHIPTQGKETFLTFDDGPHPEITPWVMDQLESNNGKGTFFCIGDNIKKYPKTYQEILDRGHGVGNHTFNHLNGWRTVDAEYLENSFKGYNAMGEKGRLFRPPYGRIKSTQAKALSEHFTLVMWDLLSGDFFHGLNQKKALKELIRKTRSGNIVVFHDSEKAWNNLAALLPGYLKSLSDLGFSFQKIPIDYGVY